MKGKVNVEKPEPQVLSPEADQWAKQFSELKPFDRATVFYKMLPNAKSPEAKKRILEQLVECHQYLMEDADRQLREIVEMQHKIHAT
jgi:hypothetical protein